MQTVAACDRCNSNTYRHHHRRNDRHLHAEGGRRGRHPDGDGELLRRGERP